VIAAAPVLSPTSLLPLAQPPLYSLVTPAFVYTRLPTLCASYMLSHTWSAASFAFVFSGSCQLCYGCHLLLAN
jgi:hypothetical protein